MNYNHRAWRELITGRSGSGKTSLWLSQIAGHRARFKFIFDPGREVAHKLKIPVVIDEPGMLKAIERGLPVCFDSSPLFPGDRRGGFKFFSQWVMDVSKAIDGVKLFAADELQSVQTTGAAGMPQGLKEIMDEGRREEIDSVFAAQRLNEINDDVRGQLTAITTLHQDDPLSLRWLEERGFDPVAIRALPVPGGWIRRDAAGGITTNVRWRR